MTSEKHSEMAVERASNLRRIVVVTTAYSLSCSLPTIDRAVITCRGVYISDSVSVDVGICNTGVIGNNDLVVAVGTFENHVRVTEKVRVWGGRHLGTTPNTLSVL